MEEIIIDIGSGNIKAYSINTVKEIKNIYLKNIMFKKNFSKESRITINNDAWLGAGVIVLQGVTIGEYAIVGAGAVVTKDIPPYSIAVGNPARVIKTVK